MTIWLGRDTIQSFDLTGEVITTPFTFASTTHAIVRNGLCPVFCDIKSTDFTIDEAKIESLITEKTSAIVPVHVYGNICNIEAIDRIAKKHHLKVIYDAAHAFGMAYKNKGIGNYGDATTYSFHATKVFNTIEGGAIAFHDPEYGKKYYQLKNYGIQSETVVDAIGLNAKMNEFQAAMGLCNLRHISSDLSKRKLVYDEYRRLLHDVPGMQIQEPQPFVKLNYAYFPVIIDESEFGVSRDCVIQALRENNIFARKYFYPLTSAFNCYQGRFDPFDTPNPNYIADRVMTLPIYPDLALDVVHLICDLMLAQRSHIVD